MEFRKTVRISGDPASALEIAGSVFANNGFRVDRPTGRELHAKGPGMRSTKQNPLVGISEARIFARNSSLDIEADLGGVRFMRYFVFLFPPALILFLQLTFLVAGMEVKRFLLPDVIFIALWLILSPLLAGLIKKRTLNALETLIHNMSSGVKT